MTSYKQIQKCERGLRNVQYQNQELARCFLFCGLHTHTSNSCCCLGDIPRDKSGKTEKKTLRNLKQELTRYTHEERELLIKIDSISGIRLNLICF